MQWRQSVDGVSVRGLRLCGQVRVLVFLCTRSVRVLYGDSTETLRRLLYQLQWAPVQCSYEEQAMRPEQETQDRLSMAEARTQRPRACQFVIGHKEETHGDCLCLCLCVCVSCTLRSTSTACYRSTTQYYRAAEGESKKGQLFLRSKLASGIRWPSRHVRKHRIGCR